MQRPCTMPAVCNYLCAKVTIRIASTSRRGISFRGAMSTGQRATTSLNIHTISFLELPFSFSINFLRDHAGHIITDPKIAVNELIANAFDAGATAADITWPDDRVGEFAIEDNGTGMTESEFNRRWRTLSYDRLKEQGSTVEFPP